MYLKTANQMIVVLLTFFEKIAFSKAEFNVQTFQDTENMFKTFETSLNIRLPLYLHRKDTLLMVILKSSRKLLILLIPIISGYMFLVFSIWPTDE